MYSLAAAKLPAYQKLIDTAVEFGKSKSSDLEEQAENAMDRLLVAFGVEILSIVPGRVSTEVDAAFSFDKREFLTSWSEKRGKKVGKWLVHGIFVLLELGIALSYLRNDAGTLGQRYGQDLHGGRR